MVCALWTQRNLKNSISAIPIKNKNKWCVYIWMQCSMDYIPAGESSRPKARHGLPLPEQPANDVAFLSSSSLTNDLAQPGELAARPPVLKSNSPSFYFYQFSPFLQFRSSLSSPEKDQRCPVAPSPKSTLSHVWADVFACRRQEFDILFSGFCVYPSWLFELGQSPREQGKKFNK